jgi:hypothetical protein
MGPVEEGKKWKPQYELALKPSVLPIRYSKMLRGVILTSYVIVCICSDTGENALFGYRSVLVADVRSHIFKEHRCDIYISTDMYTNDRNPNAYNSSKNDDAEGVRIQTIASLIFRW